MKHRMLISASLRLDLDKTHNELGAFFVGVKQLTNLIKYNYFNQISLIRLWGVHHEKSKITFFLFPTFLAVTILFPSVNVFAPRSEKLLDFRKSLR